MKKKINNKGFAVSGILYPILILTVFLIIQILTMMASRKTVLDKNKQQLLDSVNLSNKIYSNEELSILIGELQTKNSSLESKVTALQTENTTLKNTLNNKYNTTGGLVSGDVNVSGRINGLKFSSHMSDFSTDQFVNHFRSLLQAESNYAPFLTTFRSNGASSTLGTSAYGSGIAFSGGHDTQGYVYLSYMTPEMFVGAGHHDALNWIRRVAFNGDVYTVSSDKRLKYDITDIDDTLIKVYMEIQPVMFKYKKEEQKKTYTGVIAQQIIEIFKKYGLDYKKYGIIDTLPTAKDGITYYSVNYENLDTLTMLVTQYQQQEIRDMKKQIENIAERLSKLEKEG